MGHSETLRQKVRKLPHSPGVYLMKDRLGCVLYIGKAKDLQKRVSSYFRPNQKSRIIETQPKVAAMLPLIHDVEHIEVKSETEALVLEAKLIKEWKPKYNTAFTDDKQFLLVRVDIQSPIPQFRMTRNRTDSRSLYFGPFVHSQSLRKTLHELRTKYGILLGDAQPKKIGEDLYQLYGDARGEIYGHANEVSSKEYQIWAHKACAFLEGKMRQTVDELKEKMYVASEKQEYEKAAEIRDLIAAIHQTLQPSRKFSKKIFEEKSMDEPLELLHELLHLEKKPKEMECFDISHISGEFVVASMVHFTEGLPNKKLYRRYKIRSFIGNDDYRAMEEVVARRYSRLQPEDSIYPDLVVIDGGLGQVRAALKAFMMIDKAPPAIIGLAKKHETIIFPDEREPLRLELTNPALQLLQRLRDESHRFANSFNAELRSKKIKESALDDIPGLGEKRKELLLNHFKNILNLKKATIEELKSVEGIGPKFAQLVHDWLHR
ncbi:MAG: excinuclease ABC subunit C [Verrucomicrobia bacterium CG1_02_43_26]|nr:MAG: excinuclease ABC subunit C [Verrucomicrobia bacterium CG1_02_43_26]